MNLVQTVHDLMVEAHAGQTRRDRVTPFHTHPETVRYIAYNWIVFPFTSLSTSSVQISKAIQRAFNHVGSYVLDKTYFIELIEILSFSHDIPEDAGNKGFTIDYILNELKEFQNDYPPQFFRLYKETLKTLTHDDPKESYLDYILRVKENPLAVIVKLADIHHNLSTLEPNRKTNNDKYQLARYILLN